MRVPPCVLWFNSKEQVALVLHDLRCPASPEELDALVRFYTTAGKSGMTYKGAFMRDISTGMR